MPTELGDDITTFEGLEVWKSRPRTHIQEPDVEAMAKDQAFVYQFLKNENLGGTAWAGASSPGYQNHSGGGRGCPIGFPLSTINVRTSYWYAGGLLYEWTPRLILDRIVAGSPPELERVLYRWPVFVPTGHDVIYLLIRADDNFLTINPHVQVYDAPLTAGVSAEAAWTEDGDAHHNPAMLRAIGSDLFYVFTLPLTSTGVVKILSLEVAIEGDAAGNVYIHSGHVLPKHTILPVEDLAWAKASIADQAAIGEDVGNYSPIRDSPAAFYGIWDTLTAEDMPLSSYLLHKMANNDSYLYELLTGKPVPGEASILTTAHNHDGSNSPTIEIPLWGSCLGMLPLYQATGYDGFRWQMANHEAYGAWAPFISQPLSDAANTDYVMARGVFTAPERSSSPIAANWGVLLYDDTAEGATVNVKTGDTPGTIDYSGTSKSTTAQKWNYVQSTVNVKEDDQNYFTVVTQHDNAKGGVGALVAVTGICGWVD